MLYLNLLLLFVPSVERIISQKGNAGQGFGWKKDMALLRAHLDDNDNHDNEYEKNG